jgi:hypothetical protein
LKGGFTSYVKHRNRYTTSLKNNRIIITIAVAVFASLFFYSLSLSDLASTYGSLRGGGGGEGRSSGLGGSPDGGANIPTNPSSPVTSGEGRSSNSPNIPNNPSSPISGGGTGDNPGSGPVGPHGPYGPGPAGPREPRSIDDNTITKNNIYTPKTLEGPVIVNPQQAPTTTETTSQTDVTVSPTTTEEEQQQETNDDDSSQSTSTETQDQIPIANAGPSMTVQPTSNVVLDGTKSYDPNGGSLQFLWLQLAGGSTVALLNNATATPSFIAPSVPNTTTLTFQLIVSDGQNDSTPAYTYVTVQP